MNFNVVVPTTTGASFGQNEKSAARLARMTEFWKSPANAQLFPIGKFLSIEVSKGKRLADILADVDGPDQGTFSCDAVTLPTGQVLAIAAEYQTFSLKTLVASWGCPACRSAHGSGVYPSRDVVADGLANNRFYYSPAERRIFSISDTCLKTYVAKLGQSHRIAAPTKAQLLALEPVLGTVEPVLATVEPVLATVTPAKRR